VVAGTVLRGTELATDILEAVEALIGSTA